MKKALANAVVDDAKPAKVRAHLAKAIAAQPSYSKSARQAAFGRAISQLSVAKAESQAKLISDVNPAEFRIVRMPG
jgi:hypothetical protein